jgi:RHS repeat-associated protein
MLFQTSDIQQFEKGLSTTDLGSLDYGSTAGKSGRIGRAPGDPPGPHALTSVSQLTTNKPQQRAYPYDANGNMTVMEGLTNTWDFKDRLVACENGEMRAIYSYDYTDHRISKTVWLKTVNNPQPATVLYVNDFFEVRENDAPTKYVFDEDTRLARVTGSLSQNPRIQRLRIHPGWNLCSLAVSASDALSQLSNLDPQLVQAAYKWVPASTNWLVVGPGESLPAGTVLWLKAATNAVLTAVGPYVEPVGATIPAGGAFVPSAGFETWALTNGLPGDLVAWGLALLANQWQVSLPGALNSQSTLPAVLGPGRALFVQSPGNQTAQYPDPSLRIRYYHQDHLGSSSVVSDASGQLVEENTFYPFGQLRSQLAHRIPPENYAFAGKEFDTESRLQYFQSRFYLPQLGRFSRVDPALSLGLSRLSREPQRLGA